MVNWTIPQKRQMIDLEDYKDKKLHGQGTTQKKDHTLHGEETT